MLKCHFEENCFPEQAQERNGLLSHHPAPLCPPERRLCQCRAGMGFPSARGHTCTWGHLCHTKCQLCLPTVLLNGCAVCSGLNELKGKSCWELLLILYQQLTSFVLDLCKWIESYKLKVPSFGTNDSKFICAISLFSCWTELICKHTSTFLFLKSELNLYWATLCVLHIAKHSCLDCLYARLWCQRSSIAALCWRASSTGNAKMISLLYV